MGPYCKFCDNRCFVHDPKNAGNLLATCKRGQKYEKSKIGYCWDDLQNSKPQPKNLGMDREFQLAD